MAHPGPSHHAGRGGSVPFRVSVLLLIVVAGFALWVRSAFIETSLPYCSHGDEVVWASHALWILHSGDLNPHRFRKPSAHVYFMTAGFALGFVRAAANLEAQEVREMGRRVCTEYAVPHAAEVAKDLYALVSVLAMVLAGVLGYRLSGNPAVLFLAPLFVTASSPYLEYSWGYMNENVLGAFGTLATVTYLYTAREGVASVRKALLTGLLCGFTLACKYNLFFVFLPAWGYFVLYHRGRWFSHCLLVLGVALLVFFAITPYALLDLHTFIDDVAFEAYHYAFGHEEGSQATFEAGWPMFEQYYASLDQGFGGLVLALAAVGYGRLFKRDWKAAVVTLLFPIPFLIYMSQQRTFFARNILALHLFVGIGAAIGFTFLVGLVSDRLAAWSPLGRRRRLTHAIVAALAAGAVLASLPWNEIRRAYEPDKEPRNEAVAWILENAKPWYTIVVERRLGLSPQALQEAGYDVVEFKAKPETETLADLREAYGSTLILFPDFVDDEYRKIFADVTVVEEFGQRPIDPEATRCGRYPPKVRIGRL